MSMLIFIKPFDFGGEPKAVVYTMFIGGHTVESELYLDSSDASMHGVYTCDKVTSYPDVRIYKWCSQQTGIYTATSSLLVPAPTSYSLPPVSASAWLVPKAPLPLQALTPTPGFTPVSTGAVDLINGVPAYLCPESEPACLCPSPSEHQDHCQYILWKRNRRA
jgi:hypothetical protein